MAVASLSPIPESDETPLLLDPVSTARAAGLRYFTDASPGISRIREGDDFQYIGVKGDVITNPKELERIRSIGIPPAWTDVWICPHKLGHIQATGRDAKGRKQYRYHPHWREVRDETKYNRMIAFGEALPQIRERVDQDLTLHSLSHDKVVATVVRLLDETAIRVGNEEYARENASFGLTTLRTRHVDVSGSIIEFHFRGKSGKEHIVDVRDRRMARAIKRIEELPGQLLFQYLGADGERRPVDSADVNDYLRQVSGQHFTAKDFRTWHGTVTAAKVLHDVGEFSSQTQAKHNITTAIKTAAEHLGNTPAICRKSYVHPGVIDAYLDGSLLEIWDRTLSNPATLDREGLEPEEVALLALLEHGLDEERSAAAG